MYRQEIAPVLAGELPALTRVKHDRVGRHASLHRHQQSIHRQLRIDPITHRPPDDLAEQALLFLGLLALRLKYRA